MQLLPPIQGHLQPSTPFQYLLGAFHIIPKVTAPHLLIQGSNLVYGLGKIKDDLGALPIALGGLSTAVSIRHSLSFSFS
jgi:hypothetical protein